MTNSTPKPDRKPSSKSWVKNLPFDAAEAERLGCSDECTQEAVWRICRTPVEVDGEMQVPSLEDAASRCLRDFADFGCKQSLRGLMESLRLWLPWFEAKRGNAITWSKIEAMVEERATRKPGMTQEEKDELARDYFKAIALSQDDAETFVAVDRNSLADRHGRAKTALDKRKLEQKDRDLDFVERRVQLLEANAAKAKTELSKVATGGGLSPEALKEIERIAKIL